MSQTVRQGVAWGVLLLIARQAGLGIYELARSLWLPGARPSLLPHYPQVNPSLVEIALLIGWLAVFGLLVSGRRRWGLPLLGLVLAGFVTREVLFSLGYGGHFSWPFTLNFFLPVLVPLLCAFVWPERPMRLPLPLVATILIAAALVPAAQVALWNAGVFNPWYGLVSWGIQVALYSIAAVFAVLASLSDPRWALAGTVVAFQPVIREAIAGSAENRLSGAFLLVVLAPIVALLLAFRAGRRVALRRG